MAKKQVFNSVFMTSLVVFAALAIVLLLILVNTKHKDAYIEMPPIFTACTTQESDLPNNKYFNQAADNPDYGYASLVNDGVIIQTLPTGDVLCNDNTTYPTNVVTLSKSKLKTFTNKPELTCRELGLQDVSQSFLTDNRVNLDEINDENYRDLRKQTKINLAANGQDCYAIINSVDDATNILNTLKGNNFFKNDWEQRLASLRSQIAAKQAALKETKDKTDKLRQQTSELGTATDNLKTQTYLTEKETKLAEKATTVQMKEAIKIADESDRLASQILNQWSSMNLRAGTVAATRNKIIQKRHDNRYFTLLCKYSADASPFIDAAELWLNKGRDVNLDLFDSVNDIKDNLKNSSVNYRNNAAMNIVFGSQSSVRDILVEIWSVKPNAQGRIGWLLFRKPDTYPEDFASWFKPQNYVDGMYDKSIMNRNWSIFSIDGIWRDPNNPSAIFDWRRRFFMNVIYDGCEGDPSLMVIPSQGCCCWWDTTFYKKILLAKNSPVNLGGRITDEFPMINSTNTLVGNVMMIWACKPTGSPDEFSSGENNLIPITV